MNIFEMIRRFFSYLYSLFFKSTEKSHTKDTPSAAEDAPLANPEVRSYADEIRIYEGGMARLSKDGRTLEILEGVSGVSKIHETLREEYKINIRNIRDVIIPDTVTTIGEDAFRDWASLTNIILPNSVTTIGSCAFQNCFRLESITLPNSITKMGRGAFEECGGLTEITLPDNLTEIELNTFAGCHNLREISLPNSITEIGSCSFEDCRELTKIKFSDNLTEIPASAFRGCVGLREIVLPNGVMKIDAFAFGDCSGLIKVVVPNSVTEIGPQAFQGCSKLTEVVIPRHVQVDEDAFNDCPNIKITRTDVHSSDSSAPGPVFSGNGASSESGVESDNEEGHSPR